MLLLVAMTAAAESAAEHTDELTGYASWYGGKFQGRLTAGGEVFDTNELTAAHKTLAFGTLVRVTHLGNERSVVVRINDRGPFVEGRIIDLSRAAAEAIDMTAQGVARVRLEILADTAPDTRVRTIQIASFTRRTSATRVADSLTDDGLDAVVEHADHDRHAGGVYRVVIERVPESELDATVELLASLGFADVLVRSR